MLYLIVKTIHIIAVILWLGSLMLVSLITSTGRMDDSQMRTSIRVTDAAIGITWLAGIILVVMGNWYLSTWWQIKFFLVIIISAIHTILHRRWKTSAAEAEKTSPIIPYALFFFIIVVVGLAVFKQPV